MNTKAISRYLRSQGYSTRTVKRTSDARAVTAARRHEGDLLRVVIYPLHGGAHCVKLMGAAFHSKLGPLLPIVVDSRHLSGSFAEPEHIADALL